MAWRIAAILRALPDASGQGGVSYQVHQLCDRLARRGHDVTVISADPAPEGAGYRVRTLAAPGADRAGRRFAYLGFARLVAGEDLAGFDLIHAHGDNQFLARRPAPLVRTYWGSDLGEALANLRPRAVAGHALGYAMEWLGAARAVRRVAISESTRRYLPFIDDVVPAGVDLERFRPGDVKSPQPSILFVAGTLGGRKRGRLLVETFAREVRPAVARAELWVVCPEPVEGEGVRWYGKLAAGEAGMAELARLYREAWVCSVPSSYEGFGLPYVEAMASGTRVVATANAGAREVLAGGEHGAIVPPERLGAALVEALRDGPVGGAGRERARQWVGRYSFDRVVEAYETIFEGVVERWRRRS